MLIRTRAHRIVAFVFGLGLIVLLFLAARAAASPPKWSVTNIRDWSPVFGSPTSSLDRNSVSGRMTALAVSQNGKRVYAASTNTGIWRSSDRGYSWCQLNTILPCADGAASALPVTIITDIAVSPEPTDGSVVLAAAAFDTASSSRAGIYRSEDGGGHWTRVVTFECDGKVRPALAVEFAPDDLTGHVVYAAGGCQIARSLDGGIHWTVVSPAALTEGGKGDISYLAVSEKNNTGEIRWVYACALDSFYYSRDGGDTWQRETNPAFPLGVNGGCSYQNTSHFIATQPGQPNSIFMALRGNGNGPRFFDPKNQPDGTKFCSQDIGCGEAGLFYGTFPTSGGGMSTWTKLSDPPSYYGQGTDSGTPVVYTQFKPNRAGFFLFFSDETTVHLNDQVPPAAITVGNKTRAAPNAGWARLDGFDPFASLIDPKYARMFIHPDPHDILVTRNFTSSFYTANVCVNNTSAYCWNRAWGPGRGTLWIANDGGVYNFISAGGGSWDGARNLTTLFFNGAAAVARRNGPGAALYTGATDNSSWWYDPTTRNWRVPDDCGDCSPYFADVRRSDAVLHSENNRVNQYGLFVATRGNYPVPKIPCDNTTNETCINIPYPNTPTPVPPDGPALNVNAPEMLPLVQTQPGEGLSPLWMDMLKIAPISNTTTLALFRAPQQLGWQQVGPALPAGAQVVQASGGHSNPLFYIQDSNGQLYRSIYSGSSIVNWQVISGADRNLCKATSFFADPYDPTRLYADDPGGCPNSSSATVLPGIKLSTDGGGTWNTSALLEAHLTVNSHYTHNCVGTNSIGTWAGPIMGCLLNYMLFVPGQPQWRFAMGITGVYGTADGGGHWQTLLSNHKLPCNATAAALDTVTASTPTLYIFCWGRGALRIDLQLQ